MPIVPPPLTVIPFSLLNITFGFDLDRTSKYPSIVDLLLPLTCNIINCAAWFGP